MKERVFIGTLVGALLCIPIIALGSTDFIYVLASTGFFLLCGAYAWACGRL